MRLEAVPVTMVNSAQRRRGWRAILRSPERIIWRCACAPHSTPARAMACGTEILGKRGSGFYPGRNYMSEWLPTPRDDEGRSDLGAQIAAALRDEVPQTGADALVALQQLRATIMGGAPYPAIREAQARADYFRQLFDGTQAVRQLAELVVLSAEWRIAQELGEFTADRYGRNLKQIVGLSIEALESMAAELHRAGKEATLAGIVQIIRRDERTGEAEWRRLNSQTAPRMQSGMDLRIGDCRLVLGDIADESVPLILTDPPYGNEAAPLYEWLARFAARVLIPGGSLICYTGTTLLPRDHRILGAHLTYWWQAVMLHDSSQRVFGAGVIAQQKPILWYVKGQRRGRALVADVIRSRRDRLKLEHEWSQGGGGVDHWIHQLTEPEETVVDPFAGTATWGRIACELGRRWIGADIVAGGTTHIKADDLNGEEKDGA